MISRYLAVLDIGGLFEKGSKDNTDIVEKISDINGLKLSTERKIDVTLYLTVTVEPASKQLQLGNIRVQKSGTVINLCLVLVLDFTYSS